MIRITADLDDIPLTIARIRVIALLIFIKKRYNISFYDKIIKKSPSGKGCHVILWSEDDINPVMIYFIRYILGDDHRRIKKDMKRKHPKQYLFNKKIKLK